MVPRMILKLSEFPLLPGGKLDRRSLLARVSDINTAAESGSETQEEATIANIWRDILGAASIHRDDNFFEIGGSSLDAVIVLLRLEQTFGVRLDLEDFYRNPTVQSLWRALTARRASWASQRL